MKRHAQWLLGLALLFFFASGAYAGCFGGRPNGTLNLGEGCDDGNLVDTDNCTNACEVPFCGDTIVRTTHNCGADPSLTCQTNADCVRFTKCILDPIDDHCGSLANHPCTTDANCANLGTCTEACDDGNTNNCDTCQNNCTRVTGCGDGAICPPEECDPPASRGGAATCSDACRVAVCGNGIVDRPQEECDDGAASCSSAGPSNGKECGTCAGKQACDADGGTCGPGNSDTRPGACRTNCKKAFCGDGVVDDGTTTPSSLTVIAHHDEENTTTTTVRGSTTTSRTTTTTLAPQRHEVCDDGLRNDGTDDFDDCPNGPLAVAAGVACKIINRCGDAFPHLVDSSSKCAGTCGGGTGPCTGILEQCDNGNGALKTCQNNLGRTCSADRDCGTNGHCVPVKTCRNQPTRFCLTDHDCDVFPCTGTNCAPLPDICGNSDTIPSACRNSVLVPRTDGVLEQRLCQMPVCGDDVVDPGEGCDEGVGVCTSTGKQGGHECSTAPRHQACVQEGGSCVDAAGGDAGASCDVFPSNCNSDTVRDACRDTCRAAACGDGVVDCVSMPGTPPTVLCEQCDLGNRNSSAANCSVNCTAALCGDGFTKMPMSCGRDPNLLCRGDADCQGHHFDTCTSGICGDPHTRCTSNSECDTPFLCTGGFCGGPSRLCRTSADCTNPTTPKRGNLAQCLPAPNCGSDPNLQCDSDAECAPFTKCTTAGTCGTSTNSCATDADCARFAVCVEECDDGAANSTEGHCLPNCKLNKCGDGFVNRRQFGCGGDPQSGCTPPSACCAPGACPTPRPACISGRCGGGGRCCSTDDDCLPCVVIEECDDGNANDNDGCDTSPAAQAAGGGCRITGCDNCNVNMSCAGNGTVPPGATTGTCTSDADCAALGVCKSGFCGGPHRPCTRDADCRLNPSPALSPVCIGGFCGGAPVPCPNGNGDCARLAQCVVEECDDGNATCGDTCDPNCKTPGCGNGFICSPEQCDDGNMTSFDGCSFPECCLEPPGPANMTLADKFGAADCFRNAMKAELNAISTLPTPIKNLLVGRLDIAGSRQDNKCRGLRHAIVIKAMVCRRLDVLNFLGLISTDEHLQLGRKCAVLDAWYSSCADTEGCPR